MGALIFWIEKMQNLYLCPTEFLNRRVYKFATTPFWV